MRNSPLEFSKTFLTQQELLERFLDLKHRDLARQKFPKTPWAYYCIPHGQYPKQGWTFFQKAYRTAWDHAHRPSGSFKQRILNNRMNLSLILELNSLMLCGKKLPRNQVVRHWAIVYRQLLSSRMKNLFVARKQHYKNPDGLAIKVEGFLPFEQSHFLHGFYFEKTAASKTLAQRKKWIKKFKQELHLTLDPREPKYHVYFLMDPKDIFSQLKAILKFYDGECKRIIRGADVPSKKFYREVATLALKMQRYIDMTHLARDATSRTSRLIEEFVYWQFGLSLPRPTAIQYVGRQWHRSAYLPMRLALKKSRLISNELATFQYF
ncbi:MAG: hypothetical protein FJ112_10560 [Deltaproteobacteria bacterium]|nr:hypothetical protein [Deltaproteobacteria bacterium]